MRRAGSKFAYLAMAATLAACSGGNGKGKDPTPPEGRRFSLFVTTEMRGNIEPCGCNSDPMGDLARTVALVEAARKDGAVLMVDGGSTQFKELQIEPHLEAQERTTSAVLMDTMTRRLGVSAFGLGPNDLSMGAAAVAPARQAVNVPASAKIALEPPKVVDAGGVKVGIFGVVGAGVLPGIEVADATAASSKAVADLRASGAELVVALAHMNQQEAGALARAVSGVDIMVVGKDAIVDPEKVADAPRKVKATWLVQPADRGQTVVRLDITVRPGGGALVDAIGEARAKVKIESLDQRIPQLEQQIAAWEKDPSADPAFVKVKKDELAEARRERAALAANPLVVPASGSYFVMDQVRIRKSLPCDAAMQAKKVALDKEVGDANVKAAANDKPAEPAAGKAGYVGIEECSMCHAEAVDFWKKTVHARAWHTLEKYGKQFSYDCIYCHVTGWKEPGGSTLSVNEELRDVQCEVCHGPGSLHVDADGKESPKSLVRAPAAERCVQCHNAEHSDTFAYEPYLRDVTGPGHGKSFRDALGDGPTGAELRKAALERAGASVGAGCLK